MPESNWDNLNEVFHAALDMPVAERAAFIERSSKGDESLRKELESLLKYHSQTNNFLDSPAYQAAAEMLVDHGALIPSQLVAHYKIISLLGEGGMGRVYLAEDTKLHRRVALKFLSARLTSNAEWLRRFEQEARAASALNNPNILTIHEIGEADGHRFIATEFIEGQTLRERLQNGLDSQHAIDIAAQIASALVAAHRVNIVHRDIKPENIMIRDEDGLVKVLDFGLAKVSGDKVAVVTDASDSGSNNIEKTSPGLLMGTVAYMSPEQALGEPVDARTDIWSLGVVIYEMVAGHVPFAGTTSNEILSAIVSNESPAINRDDRDVPEALISIIVKALSKNRAQRYSTSQELVEDLKGSGDLLRSATKIEQSRPSQHALPLSKTTKANIARPTSSAEYIVSQLRNHKGGALATAAIALLAIVTLFAVYGWRAKHTVAAAASTEIKSLAVLPFKSVGAGDNYLGIGIADAVIRKIGQTGQLTVRPTSAVLKFARDDIDSMAAARELGTDAILEGTIQHAGDRLRITVNLLRINDGASLYSDNLDLSAADVFAIQDKVAQQVASRLELRLDSAQQAALNRNYPTSPIAYEAYIKGIFSLDERGYGEEAIPQIQTTIDFFKKAIEIDPKYALAHAQLAFAYVWTAMFIEPANPKWADLAREEIKRSQELGPNLAETHIARGVLLTSAYEGYQIEAAIRELLLARQLNPNLSGADLAANYGHIGLEDQAMRELERALAIDPTSQSLKDLSLVLPMLRADADGWFAAHQKIVSGGLVAPWYYLRKDLLDEAQKSIDEKLPRAPENYSLLMQQALLVALRGNTREAAARVPGIVAKIQPNDWRRHHSTYEAACIYALAGNAVESVKWLKETAATGFPNYPLFERDPFLNRIRDTPQFMQFMIEQKAQWEKLQQEFGGS
jgi:eukaryotic-like serine/threonine-protein kinase